jgi:hypothetical protein
MKELLGRDVSVSEVKQPLVRAFERAFQTTLKQADVNEFMKLA